MPNTLTLAEAIAAVAVSDYRDCVHAVGTDGSDTYHVQLDGAYDLRVGVQVDDSLLGTETIPLRTRFTLYRGAFAIAPTRAYYSRVLGDDESISTHDSLDTAEAQARMLLSDERCEAEEAGRRAADSSGFEYGRLVPIGNASQLPKKEPTNG